MEVSRQKYEESLLVTNGEVDDVGSEVSGSSSSSTADQRESKAEEIPEIVVDPVDDGREVSCEQCSALTFIEHSWLIIHSNTMRTSITVSQCISSGSVV